MTWQVEGEAAWELSSRQRANLVRTLREATTNALRHGTGGLLYRYVLSDEALSAEIRNTAPRSSDEDDEGPHFGLSNIAARIEELGGRVELGAGPGEFRLTLYLPREEQR
jgi:signal transduction histidine kinase